MKRPSESDYTSHVAYIRALEAYCDAKQRVGLDVEDYIKAFELCDFDKHAAFEFFEAKLKEKNT